MSNRSEAFLAVLLSGCVGTAGGVDGGFIDSGFVDSGVFDAGTVLDAGTDAGPGPHDAGHPQPPVDAGLPYLLPAAGDVLAIGTNTIADTASVFPGYTAADLQTAVFSSFGSGTFIRDYSVHGAYVFSCLGGHASPPELTGALLFDFDDATWKGFENSNGVPSALTGPGTAIANSNGMPWYEYTGTEVPLPGHPYLIPAELPSSLGGGPKGSFLMTGRAAVDESGGGGRGPHALDLSTMHWSRLTSADEVRVGGITASVVFDEDAGRYYGIGGDITCCKSIPYFQASDWSVVNETSPEYGYASDPAGSASGAFLDPVHHYIVDFRFDGTAMFLTALDLNQVVLGWQTLPVSGQLPARPAESQRWVYYPPDGHFYYREQVDGGSTLNRLTSASLDAGTPWVADVVTLTSPMPDTSGLSGYGFMFYVPAIQRLAYLIDVHSKVYVFAPPLP